MLNEVVPKHQLRQFYDPHDNGLFIRRTCCKMHTNPGRLRNKSAILAYSKISIFSIFQISSILIIIGNFVTFVHVFHHQLCENLVLVLLCWQEYPSAGKPKTPNGAMRVVRLCKRWRLDLCTSKGRWSAPTCVVARIFYVY